MNEHLEKIHQTSIRILTESGIQIEHPQMIERLVGMGCKFSNGRLFFSSELIQGMLDLVPTGFRVYGRNDQTGVEVKIGTPYRCTNTGIMPYMIDFESGAVRRPVLKDVETSTRILDALSEVDIVYVSLVDATELPSHLVTLADFSAAIRNTTKPLIGPGVTNRSEAKAVLEMAAAINDAGLPALSEKPTCAPFIGAITPLRFPSDFVDALEEVALAGLPLMALSNPVMGASSPYSIAGTVALGHSEMLAWIVMAYTLRPGLPVLSFNSPSIADMRSLASTTGGPEAGLARSLAVEVAQYNGIPAWAHGHTSSAHLDTQASDEKSLNALLIAQAKPSLLGGLGGLANVTLTSYETLVVDNERLSALRRIEQGIAIDDEHLAYSVIEDIIRGEDLLSHTHTLKHLRSREVWKPKLARRQGLIGGMPEPKTTLDRAREEVQHIVKNHRIEPLHSHTEREIDEIIRQYSIEI
jgi:trimethylamine---corrinoid protein Co-methyltransferase